MTVKGRSETIALITREPRLTKLKRRRATARAAEFVLNQAQLHEVARQKQRKGRVLKTAAFQALQEVASFDEYEEEARAVEETVSALQRNLDFGVPITRVERELLPNFDFSRCLMAMAVGPDGLVANAAKYAGDVPLIGVNPDPKRNDGILLPFSLREARDVVRRVLNGRARMEAVTLAEVTLNDGQILLAFNDFFIGARSHVSARYTINDGERAEPQSSSGVIVATGAGSTGWMSSLFNMVNGMSRWQGSEGIERVQLGRSDPRLFWMVREPFVSQHSRADMVAGLIEEDGELVLESLMPESGVIFSDGIEADRLEFTSGVIARIGVSRQRARLVVR